MKHGITLTQWIDNLKMSKKLGLGFGLVLLTVMVISLFGMSKFAGISQRADKVVFSNKVSKLITDAQLSSALYQQNYLPSYFEKNQKDIKELQQLLDEATHAISWDKVDQENINLLPVKIKEYLQAQDTLRKAIEEKEAIRKSWDLSPTEATLQDLQRALLIDDADPMVRLSLADVTQKLISIRYYANALLLSMSKESEAQLIKVIDDMQGSIKKLAPVLMPEQKTILEPTIELMATYRSRVVAYMPAYEKEQMYARSLQQKSSEMNSVVETIVNAQLENTHSDINQATLVMSIVTFISLALGVLISWLITRQITHPLLATLDVAEQIANGELAVIESTSRQDELGLLINAIAAMSKNLRNTITEIHRGGALVGVAIEEIDAGNTDLSARTEQQAAAVEQTAASMEQLSSTVKLNAENAHQANILAAQASQNANNGGKQVNQVIHTMQEITGSSKKISEITSVINSIAFQTNILALNAAVEAARAGEQGRGFAVVASEVRNLAQRSASAAKEIEDLITESASCVTTGAKLVESTGKTMTAIVQSIDDVCHLMNDIASASDEQSRGIANIALAIAEMDTATQQNSGLVQQSAMSIGSLKQQAQGLNDVVSVFRVAEAATSHTGKSTRKIAPSSPTVKGSTAKTEKPSASNDDWETF
jgi:methyl-accepting chemotaxis protein-2 (aspartate sensor receptor)